jgi:uncharacterized protein (TIGR00288 family)
MATASDTTSMALFCDFENIALGVRDAKYEKFDIKPVLERLLAKGSIVVKKAYCDWERYKGFKATMHEANFELIEIPHVRQSGKNSADIRMVVDALDLCYTKAHVDTFVIISGDSDFSPLVSKLRENAKQVIGVGVKQSCSDLLVTNCDEFIYYDDLVRDREAQRSASRREQAPKRTPEEEKTRREEIEARRVKAVELAIATFEDLIAVRGEAERIWASQLKEAIKRRNPGFNESYFGYKTFGALLEDAATRGGLGVGRDEKSGTYVTRALARSAPVDPIAAGAGQAAEETSAPVEAASTARGRGRGRGRKTAAPVAASEAAVVPVSTADDAPAADVLAAIVGGKAGGKAAGRGSSRGKASAQPVREDATSGAVVPARATAASGEVPPAAAESGKAAGAKKPAAPGGRRPRAKPRPAQDDA